MKKDVKIAVEKLAEDIHGNVLSVLDDLDYPELGAMQDLFDNDKVAYAVYRSVYTSLRGMSLPVRFRPADVIEAMGIEGVTDRDINDAIVRLSNIQMATDISSDRHVAFPVMPIVCVVNVPGDTYYYVSNSGVFNMNVSGVINDALKDFSRKAEEESHE